MQLVIKLIKPQDHATMNIREAKLQLHNPFITRTNPDHDTYKLINMKLSNGE